MGGYGPYSTIYTNSVDIYSLWIPDEGWGGFVRSLACLLAGSVAHSGRPGVGEAVVANVCEAPHHITLNEEKR